MLISPDPFNPIIHVQSERFDALLALFVSNCYAKRVLHIKRSGHRSDGTGCTQRRRISEPSMHEFESLAPGT
jgi:hypothetical protein